MTSGSSPTERPPPQDLSGVLLLDTCHLGGAGTVGSFLLPGERGRFALVETGSGATLATLLESVRTAGFELEALEAVLLTHVHLDHAGAAGALAAASGAVVYAHALGVPHLADPSRLLASAGRIYGDEMERLWGAMLPVLGAQLRSLEGGERLEVAGRTLRVLYTPGHAAHHVAYLLEDDALFTGDAAGIRMAGSSVIRPALPPPEIDLETWQESVARMRSSKPRRLLLTHFGEVAEADEHLALLPERNRSWAEVVLAGLRRGESEAELIERIAAVGDGELLADGASPEVAARHRATSNYRMSVLGLSRYWRKHHPEALGPTG